MFSLQSKMFKEFFSHFYVLKHNMPKPLRKVRDERCLPASDKNECEGKSYLLRYFIFDSVRRCRVVFLLMLTLFSARIALASRNRRVGRRWNSFMIALSFLLVVARDLPLSGRSTTVLLAL